MGCAGDSSPLMTAFNEQGDNVTAIKKNPPPRPESWMERMELPYLDKGEWYLVMEGEYRTVRDAVTRLRNGRAAIPDRKGPWEFQLHGTGQGQGELYARYAGE